MTHLWTSRADALPEDPARPASGPAAVLRLVSAVMAAVAAATVLLPVLLVCGAGSLLMAEWGRQKGIVQ